MKNLMASTKVIIERVLKLFSAILKIKSSKVFLYLIKSFGIESLLVRLSRLGLMTWLGLGLLTLLSACSDPEFSQKQPRPVSQEVNAGKVDILFVVDNSGSMFVEQVKMANAFPYFLSGLELNNLDYRIAITTTDVISNNNPEKSLGGLSAGSLQNGRLIKFPDGKLFLDSSSANIENQFRATIQRQETLDCETFNFESAKCPSGDERGIYAATLAVKRNEGNFFRTGSHIATVFLSDEDERGQGFYGPSFLAPTAGDYPTTLVRSVFEDLGASHSMSSHAIVVTNNTCKNSQLYQVNNENILAYIGYFYMHLANPNNESWLNPGLTLGDFSSQKLVPGTIGNICNSNYTQELGSIRNTLVQVSSLYTSKKDLDCRPEPNTFQFDYCPAGVNCSLSSDQKSVNFYPSLRPDQTAKFSYKCP